MKHAAIRLLFLSTSCCLLPAPLLAAEAPPVRATQDAEKIQMENGTVALEISRKEAQIISIRYRRGRREIEMGKLGNSMYFDSNAGPTDVPRDMEPQRPRAGYAPLARYADSVRLVSQSPEAAEVALAGGPTFWFPFRTEIHYVLRRGESGFYAYALYRHGRSMPAASLGQTRFVIRGPAGAQLYTDHIVDDRRQGPFPTSPVVRPVMDATFLLRDGTVYTKYNNTVFEASHKLHGMAGHGVGIWVITPSSEFVNGGPVKQNLTVHMDNVALRMLQSGHFGSGALEFKPGEEWTKFYGPFFVYLNGGASVAAIYADAKRRTADEIEKWPYRWAKNPEYPVARGTVTGQIRLTDGETPQGAWVILGAPGGDWPLQGKGYLFWTQAGRGGQFTIPKVRPGQYTLYTFGANQFEQFQRDGVLVVADQTTDLGTLNWKPVRHGRRLWQIGVADRSTREFRDGDDIRHWANYMRYPKEFPHDVTFVIGKSHAETDWNFAQWTWYSQKPYWTIEFDLPRPISGTATLTLGFASSQPVRGPVTNLQVKINGQEVAIIHLPKSGTAGYRSGGQDSAYRVRYVTFDASRLKAGLNEITLGHQEAQPFPSPAEQMQGRVGQVMYDAIRLEVTPQVSAGESANMPSRGAGQSPRRNER
jgi:rhamnogalacturonan endolyase